MTVSEAHRWKNSPDPSVRAEAARVLKAREQRARRVAPRKAPGLAAEAKRKERDAAFYENAKREAAARATLPMFGEVGTGGPRCEFRAGATRCALPAADPDHVLGGAERKVCERLGAEGLMCLCRIHHDQKHANAPTRAYWLALAEGHALLHGYRRLLGYVYRARAKYEAKHPLPASRRDAGEP